MCGWQRRNCTPCSFLLARFTARFTHRDTEEPIFLVLCVDALASLPSWSCRPGMSQTSQQESTAPLKTSPSQRAALRMGRSTAALPLPRMSSPSPGAAVSLCLKVGKKPETNVVPCIAPQADVDKDCPLVTVIPVSGSEPHLGSRDIGGEGILACRRLVL